MHSTKLYSRLSQAFGYTESIPLAKAVRIIRRHTLDQKSIFDEYFHERFVKEAIPPTCLRFVRMIDHADITSQLSFGASKTCVAMVQLLHYNFNERYKDEETHGHSKDRETPYLVYMGLSVVPKTRKRHLTELLQDNGISIS